MFQTVCKVSVRSGGFPDNRDIFGSGRFLDSQEGFQTVWKVSHHGCHGLHGMYAKAIYALLGTFMSQNYLHTFSAFLSRTWFTRSVRKVFARDILPTGKFWLFVSLECRRARKWLLTLFRVGGSTMCPPCHVFAYTRECMHIHAPNFFFDNSSFWLRKWGEHFWSHKNSPFCQENVKLVNFTPLS